MSERERRDVVIPDLGDFHDMPVVEISVAPGDVVAAEQTILMVESEKATMDVPAPFAGRIVALKVAVGDKVNTGTVIALVESLDDAVAAESAAVFSAPVVLPVPEPANASEPALPIDGHADLLVIGAGPGGYTAAIRGAQLGLKTAARFT